MNESILLTIKKMLGLAEDYDAFDLDVITDINSVFTILMELGVMNSKIFYIKSKDELWSDYLGEGINLLELVKTYIYLKVRLMFDPPQSGVLHQAMERQISEYEWRLNQIAEGYFDIDEVNRI